MKGEKSSLLQVYLKYFVTKTETLITCDFKQQQKY